MDQKETKTLKLFISSVVENKDEVEEKYERCYRMYQDVIAGLSEKEAQNALNIAVTNEKVHEEVSLGILFIILTTPEDAARSFRDLMLITRDGLGLVMNHLSQLLMDRFLRLTELTRGQVMWIVKELIRNSISNTDHLCWIILRHAAGGDVSAKNISLVEALLEIFQEFRVWLGGYPLLIAAVAYSFLRLIEDHTSPHLSALRQKEVTFVVGLIREKFQECLGIGRDFVRVIQNVSRIPEIDALWRDMVLNPKSLSPSYTGILQILQTRTSRRYLQTRLTPDMERKLVFLTSHVRFGYQKRYQEWFIRQYLSTPEAQTLRCDLIRFIVGVIHPTNELLCSDIIPRWAIIGWLLTTCTSMTAASNAKLALFYDWLFFSPEVDNIMNIEPAVLVMHNSMRSHPAITATLLDFLCRIMHQFYPPFMDKVRAGVFASLRQILEKRVLPTLCPLFDNPKLDQDLRTMVRETFKEFCLPPVLEGVKVEEFPGPILKEEVPDLPLESTENHRIQTTANNHLDEPAFSDDDDELPKLRHEDEEDDDDIPLAKVYQYKKERPGFADELEDKELGLLAQLEGDVRKTVEVLRRERDNEARCQAAERLVQLVIEEEVGEDTVTSLATCLCSVLQDNLEGKVFPGDSNEEAIEDSIGRPLFVLLRGVAQLADDDSRRNPLLSLLAEMATQAPRLGYLLLYYLKACKLSETKSSVYKDFCQTLDRTLEEGLLADLKLCQEEDVPLLVWLVPDIYAQFPTVAVGHVGLLHLVVAAVDAAQLQDLVCRIVQGQLVMFRRDSFRALLSASLNWETFEQYCLWQLVTAHGIPVDYILPILPRLEFAAHAEALTAILLMLKQERPTPDLLRHLLSREVRGTNDVFVVSALKYWCREHEELLGEILSSLLSSRFNNTTTSSSTSPTKRKRGGGGSGGSGGRGNAQAAASAAAAGPPSTEQLLGHLDQLRLCDGRLYALDCVQRALQQAQAACSDAQRKRFSDLFALAEVDELEVPTPPQPAPTQANKGRPSGGGRGRKAAAKSIPAKRQAPKEVSESSSESTEEEEVVKPKQPKKRKKVMPVGSDSD